MHMRGFFFQCCVVVKKHFWRVSMNSKRGLAHHSFPICSFGHLAHVDCEFAFRRRTSNFSAHQVHDLEPLFQMMVKENFEWNWKTFQINLSIWESYLSIWEEKMGMLCQFWVADFELRFRGGKWKKTGKVKKMSFKREFLLHPQGNFKGSSGEVHYQAITKIRLC